MKAKINALTNYSDLQITATVPPGATTGPITIETPHGSVATTSSFSALTLPTLSFRPLPGTKLVELSWISAPGFSVEQADFARAATWTPAQVFFQRLSNGVRIVNVSLVPSNRFFRLRLQSQ